MPEQSIRNKVTRTLLPCFSLLPMFLISPVASGQTWHNLGRGVNNEFNNAVVYSISCDTTHDMVYAGGSFDTAGGITARYIASWNGLQWDSLGGGMNAPIQATLFYNDTLYAGGDFTMAAGISLSNHCDSSIYASHIARWTGTQWDTLGSGLNGSVYALGLFNGKLYAGGSFTRSGSKQVSHIAVWNGVQWDSVGNGFNSDVYSITVWNGSLCAAGNFDSSGTASANHVAQWNGSAWMALGKGLNGYVNALMPYRGLLYAAGNFDTAGGITADYIAAWNGSAWDTAGPGVNQEASALDTNRGLLYAGGYFTTAGNKTVNGIASWNGVQWDSLSAGVGAGSIAAIASYKASILAGGNFSTAGYIAANSIAFWDTGGGLFVPEINTGREQTNVFPNPNKGVFTLHYDWQTGNETIRIEIYDMLGQLICSLTSKGDSSGQTVIDVSSQPAGVYLYRALDRSGGLIGQGKFVIIR